MASFQQLLEQSRELTAHITAAGQLPVLERGLAQIEAQSRRLASKAARDGGAGTGGLGAGGLAGAAPALDSRAQFMLAKQDFDPERVSQDLATVNLDKTFRAVPPVSEGDLEQFLEDAHQETILSSLESQKRRTWEEQEDLGARAAYRAWENAKQRIFEDLGQHKAPSSASTSMIGGKSSDAFQGLGSLARSATGTSRTPVTVRTSNVSAPGAYPASPTSPRAVVPAGPAGALQPAGQQVLEGTSAGGVQLYTKMNHYATVIENLNAARLQGARFDLIKQLTDTSNNLDAPGRQESFLKQSWDLLARLTGPIAPERQHARAYGLQTSAFTSTDAVAFRRKLSQASRKFYEDEFSRLVDRKIEANPRQAQLGSKPGSAPKARAYINLVLRSRDRWVLPSLELVGQGEFKDTPIWALIYYLLRMGKGREALSFASSAREDLERFGDTNLIEYLGYWVQLSETPGSSGDRVIRDQIASEYNQRIRLKNGLDAAGNQQGDPFKLTVYKILGRCELAKKMIPGPYVVVGTEDYVWLQLVLSQEIGEGEAPSGGDVYGLRDVARHFLRYGPEYFNPHANQGNPLMWFMVLLACGEFERACHYLANTDRYAVEAVHFAIALAYAGMLRVPDSPVNVDTDLISEQELPEASTSSNGAPLSALPLTPTASGSGGWSMLSKAVKGPGASQSSSQQSNAPPYRLASFDFARLMHQYTRSFYRTDPSKALQYIYLICMYGKAPTGAEATPVEVQKAEAYNALAHRYIRDVILDTREYGALLGTVRPDGTRVAGQLEKFAPLLNLYTPQTFIASITKKAAEKAERDGGRFNDAVQLYNLAEEYDTVMRIVNRYLGETLAQRQFAVSSVGADVGIDAFGRSTAGQLGNVGTSAIDDALRISSDLTSYYDSNPVLSSKVSPEERETCSVLTSLLKFMKDYEEAKLDAALQNQVDLGLLPLDVRDRASRADSSPFPAEMVAIRKKALNVGNLNENISRSVPMIIVATMDCLYRLWKALRSSSFQDPARAAAAREYKMMADNIVMFAGQMEFRMAPDVYSKLNRLAVVYMSG